MYRLVAKMVGLAPGESQVSQPIPMGNHNTVQIDFTVISGEAKVTLEDTNNLEDWSVRQAYSAVVGPGHSLLASLSIECSHVRIRWEEATSINPATVGGGINCSKQ